jgi:tetratricopeptide (TPR) repeat protein
LKVTDYNWPIYLSRGVAYGHLGNYTQTIDDCSRAIKIKPGYAEAYINRGVAYVKLGNKNLAVTDLKTAAKLGDERAKHFLRSQGISW